MNEEALDALTGQIAAINLTLTSVIFSMRKERAALSAQVLEGSLQDYLQDSDDNTPAAELRSLQAVANAYLDLLRAAALRD